jgi:hypothetical protein
MFVFKNLSADQKKEFEEGLKKGIEALKNFEKGSDEYKKLKRALAPFWDFKKDVRKSGVKDGISVSLKDPKKSTTGASTDIYANGRADVAFGSSLLKNPVLLGGAISNEGYSIANKGKAKRNHCITKSSTA